jgi:signal transduction histidine kinase
MFSVMEIFAQEKQLVQIKTFNEQLQPYKNIDISINDKEFIHIDNKAVAFIELYPNEFPLKTIKIKNVQLEAASWNYRKGIVEVIIRKKSYHMVTIQVMDNNAAPLIGKAVTFNGRKVINAATNEKGVFEIPLALDEKIGGSNQFVIRDFNITSMSVAGNHYTLIAVPVLAAPVQELAKIETKEIPKDYFSDFDLSKLDSIQSLTVFYAIFKNYQIKDMSPGVKKRVDAKFDQLVRQLEDSIRKREVVFIGKISDSSFVDDDIENLLAQARLENQTLEIQRSDFDKKMELIQEKMAAGVENLDPETRSRLLSDLTRLEAILTQNENKFYKNQNDYRAIINSIKTSFFDFEGLENKLSASEAQRLEQQRIFRQRLIITVSIALVFAVLIVLLIIIGRKLKKQKGELILANNEVKRINENLEQLVSARTKLLEAANKELDTFLYRASHDLRSPVCSIIGLCNLAGHFSSGETKDLLEKVVFTTSTMDRLLKKLTIISEINEPSDFATVNLVDTIQDVSYNARRAINDSRIQFTMNCPDDLKINTYPNLLEAIFANLLENAMFFSSLKTGSEPQVELTASVKHDMVEIIVYDNGVGIDNKISEKIYDMFFKGNVYSKGNGLGLYIVQKSVHALGGDIWVVSEPGQFTRFVVNLPFLPLKPEKKLLMVDEGELVVESN